MDGSPREAEIPGQPCSGRGRAAAWKQRAQVGPGRSQVHTGTRLLGDTDLPKDGPTTPEGVVLQNLEREARHELMAQIDTRDPTFYSFEMETIDMKVEELANSRLVCV